MNFEVLKKNNLKRNIVIGGCVVLISAVILNFSSARYRSTASVPIVDSEVNYVRPDLNIVAMYQKEDGGEYVSVDTIPTSGYNLNTTESYCKVGDEVDSSIPISYEDGRVYIGVTNRGTKCYLYFDEKTGNTITEILAGYNKSTRSDFNTVYTASTTKTVFSAIDWDGTSYYFAGAPTDNYVKFGKWTEDTPDVYIGYYSADISSLYKEYSSLLECSSATSYNNNCTLLSRAGKDMYWRIIRVNGDGSIRLIYQGTSTTTTGVSAQIGTSEFNSSIDYSYYVGLSYDGTQHGTGTSSAILDSLNNWYSDNIVNVGYGGYIDNNAGYCSDRVSYLDTSGTTESWTASGSSL